METFQPHAWLQREGRSRGVSVGRHEAAPRCPPSPASSQSSATEREPGSDGGVPSRPGSSSGRPGAVEREPRGRPGLREAAATGVEGGGRRLPAAGAGPGRAERGSGRRLVSVRGQRGRAQDARRRRRRSSGRSGSSRRNRRCGSMSGAAAKQPPGAGSADKAAAAAGDSVPEPPPPSLLSVDVTGLVSQFARSFVLIFPVYVLGYLGLSFSWVLIALCGLFWIRRHRGGKTSRLGRALAFLEDEEEAVRLSVSSADLPAWVSAQQRPSALPREQPSPAAGLGPAAGRLLLLPGPLQARSWKGGGEEMPALGCPAPLRQPPSGPGTVPPPRWPGPAAASRPVSA